MRLPTAFSAKIAALASISGHMQSAFPQSATIWPKIVILAYCEVGSDECDRPGELQYRVERDHFDLEIAVAGMSHPVRANANASEIAVVAGPGNIHPAVNPMAFGSDSRFDRVRPMRKKVSLFFHWLITDRS